MSTPFADNVPPIYEDTRRNYSGWIALGALTLLLLYSSSLASSKTKPGPFESFKDEQSVLKQVMSRQSLAKAISNPTAKRQKVSPTNLSDGLDDSISSLAQKADTNPVASMLYAEMRTLQNKPIPPEHLEILRNSKSASERSIYSIYSSKSLTRPEANRLISKLPGDPFMFRVARAQALEKAGDKNAVSRLVSAKSGVAMAIGVMAFGPFFFLSMVVWLHLYRKYRDGTLEPKGIPIDGISLLDADRLAVRGAQIFGTFVMLQALFELLSYDFKLQIPPLYLGSAAGLLTILCIFALQSLPIEGKCIRLTEVGCKLDNLKGDVTLGILGFFAELPVTMLLGILCSTLFRWLPQGSSQATEMLAKKHDLATLLPLLFIGSVVAPFWEELVFRGMIFPGLKRVFGRLIPAIVLSSLLFACAHAQGIPSWIPLGFVGASCCFLSYQSRSLVPGMVMHCLHNTAIFTLVMLMNMQ